ncbi:hypothetical protein AB0K18_25655 [Nonomuraea sp. NPDC049421]|uniref:hypothetical protein n=1 Tax=Nonomuraea sp. NPDC049421 TaxID=3155275 RepID=UPI0034374117
MSRHRREPGTLPRPLAVLGALALAAGTAAAIRMLPAGAAPRPERPPAARPVATQVEQPLQEPPSGFVAFTDATREPPLDLAAHARRTGLRHYALGHLVAAGDGCTPTWAGKTGRTRTLDGGVAGSGGRSQGSDGGVAGRNGGSQVSDGEVVERVGRLRVLGGGAVPVFGGPRGRELAVACTRPGALTAAYRRVVGTLDATSADFEIRDSADRAAVLRRAHAIEAVQRERPLRVSFTLPLGPGGLSADDVAMLRTTRRAGAEVSTVNLLAPVEPRTPASTPAGTPAGTTAGTSAGTSEGARLGLMAAGVRKAAEQLAEAHDLRIEDEVWPHLALTPVQASTGDLSAGDARRLTAYATRHRLAWLSLRGAAPQPDVSRILWHTPANR